MAAPQPSIFASIMAAMHVVATTRKGAYSLITAVFATVSGFIFCIAMTASYFQGKLTPDVYWTKLQVAWGVVGTAWTIVVGIYMGSTAYEDRGKNMANANAPPPAQSGALDLEAKKDVDQVLDDVKIDITPLPDTKK